VPQVLGAGGEMRQVRASPPASEAVVLPMISRCCRMDFKGKAGAVKQAQCQALL